MNKNIVISGIRPTGTLHLGHYYGILKNCIKFQSKFSCFFFVADLHALTTHFNKLNDIKFNSREIIIDFLSIGINPTKSTLFIQSMIPEHYELYLLLSMITPLNWLKRIPSYKNKQYKNLNLLNHGFLGYSILQAADIILYKSNIVLIGNDQLPHIEIIRKIFSRFNKIYNINNYYKENFLKKPNIILSKNSCFPGINGMKMSKSYNNTIGIREKKKSILKKINKMVTDPNRIYKHDKGNPNICLVWKFHLVYSSNYTKNYVNNSCRTAYIGCLDCKKIIIDSILKEQEIILENAQQYIDNPSLVDSIIDEGCYKASKIAKKNIKDIRKIIFLKS